MFRLILVAALLCCACNFDGSGPSALVALGSPDGGTDTLRADARAWKDAPGPADDTMMAPLDDTTPDTHQPDLAIADSAPTDGTGTDTAPVLDAKPADSTADQRLDQGVAVYPITTNALSEAFDTARVECVDRHGIKQGGQVPIVDRSAVSFLSGTATVDSGPKSLRRWVDGAGSVVIVWDINACDLEDPVYNDNDWYSAGLLIRGASIDREGRLVLKPQTTLSDMNVLDVSEQGTFEVEVGETTDASLAPQLVNPTNTAKEIVLKLGGLSGR